MFGTVDLINASLMGASLLFGVLALLGAIFYKKRLFNIDKIRMFTEFFLVVLLNFTVLGNLYISPFLPILRMDIPKLMARGSLKACPLAIIQRVFSGTWEMVYFLAVAAVILVVCAVVGRALCGWACPFGLVQDLLNKLRDLLQIKILEPSRRLHNALGSVRFALLFLSILLSLTLGLTALLNLSAGTIFGSYLPVGTTRVAPFCAYCPTPVTYYLLSVLVGTGFQLNDPVHYALWPIAFLFVAGAFLIPRFFCRYICPVGALSSVFNKFSLLHIHKEHAKCTKCNVCYTHCPTRVEAVRDTDVKTRVSDIDCTFCGECVERCYERALSFKLGPVTIYQGGQSWSRTWESSKWGKKPDRFGGK